MLLEEKKKEKYLAVPTKTQNMYNVQPNNSPPEYIANKNICSCSQKGYTKIFSIACYIRAKNWKKKKKTQGSLSKGIDK